MAIHCFYHGCDLDGHCSGAIVKFCFPGVVMHPINYGDEFPWDEIKHDDKVFMTDFCLQPFNEMIKLHQFVGGDLIWIDHHSSAINEHSGDLRLTIKLTGNGYLILGKRDTSKAACELTWEYLFPDRPVPLAVKLLSLYDSWTYQGHKLEPMVLPFQMRMRMEDMNPYNPHSDHAMANWEQWFLHDHGCVLVGGNTLLERFVQEGKLLLRYDDEQKRRYVQMYGFETRINYLTNPPKTHLEACYRQQATFPDNKYVTYKAIALNIGMSNSKVFDSVRRKDCDYLPHIDLDVGVCPRCNGLGHIEPYDLMITFCRRSDKKWNVSLYSTKADIDCGAIAKSFGGGGHKGAAGFQCEDLPFEY